MLTYFMVATSLFTQDLFYRDAKMVWLGFVLDYRQACRVESN
jgi:hypothetical protein